MERGGPAVTVGTDGFIYAIGGANGTTTWFAMGTAERFNEATMDWEDIEPLRDDERRMEAKAVTDSFGRIWVIGGIYGDTIFDSVQRYDPSLASWETMSAKLKAARVSHGAAIGADDSIYVFGGWNTATSYVNLESAERYDPVTGAWEFVRPMNEARWSMAFATDDEGRIYAIGGTTWGGSPKASVERCDPSRDVWEYMRPYPQALASSIAFTLRSEIWVVGGWNAGYTNACFIYSPTADEWRPGPAIYEGVGQGGGAVGPSGAAYLVGGQGPSIQARDRVAMFVPPNRPPMANANGPYTANATSWNGAAVPLCGQESHDPDGDEITYAWDLNTSADSDGDGDPTNDVDCTEMNPTALFPIGVSEVSLIVADGHGLMSEPAVSAVTVNLIPVEIDIRPYTEWNIIVLGSSGLLPVAFLTNRDFDARTIDPATVTQPGREFSGLVKIPRFRRRPLAWHRDVDRDGDVDLVVFIENDELILDPDDFECSLGALTYDGFVVMGTDKVCIFRPRRCHTWRP